MEYAAYAFREQLTALGFVQSMNRPREIRLRFTHPAELVQLVRSYIPYYNGVRLHSGIGYSSPIDYEARAT